MLQEILIQAIGFVAAITLGLGFLQKDKKSILIYNIIAGLIFAIHYYLLDGLTGALCNIPIPVIFIYFYEKKYGHQNAVLKAVVAIILMLVISLPSFQDIFSVLPILASVAILAGLSFKNENTVRIFNIIGGIFWLSYSAVVMSWSGVISESIIIIMTAIGLWKYRKKC